MTAAATRVRRELAERIAQAYVGVGAEAVLLGGSTGRGEADRYSDIEVGVFWRRAPTDDEYAGIPHVQTGFGLKSGGGGI